MLNILRSFSLYCAFYFTAQIAADAVKNTSSIGHTVALALACSFFMFLTYETKAKNS